MSERQLLLFGGSGQVGRALIRALAQLGTVVAPTRADADLGDSSALRDIIRRIRPAAIVNVAALTNVDRSESEPDVARALNEIAPGVMAEEARRIRSVIVHFSTDYVFDGDSTLPYAEDAVPNPINVYGRSKLGGEHNVAAADGQHLIVRTSWVYSADGKGFVPTLLRQLHDRREVRVVADQTGSPTWNRSLALATASILGAFARNDGFDVAPEDRGVYHLGGRGVATRVEIANEVIAATTPAGREPTVVIPISSAEFAAAAPRPRYSALSNARATRRFGLTLGAWRAELRQMLSTVE